MNAPKDAPAICLSLEFRTLGITRKVDSEALQTSKAQKAYMHHTKKIFLSAEYNAIKRRDSATKEWLKSLAIPAPALRKGVYLCPIGLVEKIDKRLPGILEERKALVAAFQAVYTATIQQAALDLKEHFNEDDYPAPENIPSYFGMAWRYMALDTPTSLKNISKAMFDKEQKKAEEQWKLAMDEARKVLRASMHGLVAKMTDALAPDEFGDSKTFKDGVTAKMRDFLALFNARDITGDAQLAGIVKQAKDLVRGLRAEDINSDKEARQKLGESFAEIKDKLDSMVTLKPKRAITFEQEV